MVENKHVGICFNSWKSNKVVAIHFSFGSFFHFPDTMTDGLTEFRTENYEIHIERTSAGLGLSIAGGRGSTPYKGNDEGIFISRVTEGGPADLAGLKVGDKVLKVNGISVIEADHYHAVDILKACGSVLVLVVSREITRLVGHPVFTNEGPVAQIVISNQPTHTVPIQQTEQIINTSAKTIPSPIQIHSEHQEQHLSTPHSNGFIENGRVIFPLHVSQNKVQNTKKNSFPYVDKKMCMLKFHFRCCKYAALILAYWRHFAKTFIHPTRNFKITFSFSPPHRFFFSRCSASYWNPKTQEITHKITLHTTLIRDQIGQGLGFSIAGGKGSPPFKDGSDGIYISRITEGGLAHRDAKILVGDKVLVVCYTIYAICIYLAPLFNDNDFCAGYAQAIVHTAHNYSCTMMLCASFIMFYL